MDATRTRTTTTATLALYVGGLAAGGMLLATRTVRANRLAVSAGLLWAASDTSIKALSSHLGTLGAGVLLQPLALVILLASLLGLLVSARSLQLGDAVPVIAITSAAANLTTIVAGPVVFCEPMPAGQFELVLRVLAFALVVSAAALTPPPIEGFHRGLSPETTRVPPNVLVIVGCGRVGSAVAKRALDAGHKVSVLDSDPLSHERLDQGQMHHVGGRRREGSRWGPLWSSTG